MNLAGESEVWLTQLISAADLTSMVQHRHRRRITSMLYRIELLKKTRVRSGCSMILLHQAIPFPVLSLAGPKHHFVLVCAIRQLVLISLTLTANLAARRSPKSQDAVKRIHGRTSPDEGTEPVGRISFQGDSISRPAIGCCPRPLCSVALRHHKHHGDKRRPGLGPAEATGAVAGITGTME